MREMKDSVVEWIGIIPESWSIIKLKYLCSVKSGEMISKDEYEDDGQFEIVGANGCIGRLNSYNNKEKVLTTGRVGTIGTTYKVKKAWITDNALIICVNNTSDYDYLFWTIPNFDFKLLTAGTAMPLITASKLMKQYVPVMPVDEKDRIVEYLDSKCSLIDSIINKQETIIEKLKEYRLSVITEAVTKGLDPNVEMKDSGIEWIGKIPSNWKVTKLKYIFGKGDKGLKIGPFGSAMKGKTLEDGPYKIYNQAHLISNDFSLNRHFVSEETFEELKSYEVCPGDVLFSMMGTIGKCQIMPSGFPRGIMDSHLLKAGLNNQVNPRFLLYAYDKDCSNQVYPQLLYLSNGTIMNGLNSSILKNVYMALPPIHEQELIVDHLDSICKQIDDEIKKRMSVKEKLTEYKKSLIYEVVTGKKEV